MKKLPISWLELEMAFETSSADEFEMDLSSYFDKETGHVIVIDESMRELIDSIIEDVEEAGLSAEWTDANICETPTYEELPDSLKALALPAINLVHGANGDRFESVPDFSSHDAFSWMEAFIETVTDDAVREELEDALRQRKPFRKFKDAIESDRRLSANWYAFEAVQQREAIIEWLESIEVEPLNPMEGLQQPVLPELRRIMLAEAQDFVRVARELPGVERIALIGSLTTDKEFPKDIDFMVTISEDCNLKALAKLGRQLKGKMVAHTSGADVFLASPSGKYLGRTCAFKICKLGQRASCDARSCGRYVNDDFGTVRLSQELIANPPVELWPQVRANCPVPADVEEQLLEPLSLEQKR